MVLSEPFGRIEARTTYGKVPPRKRPALGRRYRPEQDFSSGLRRRDDRRTGTPDPCSAALYGGVLKASSERPFVKLNCAAIPFTRANFLQSEGSELVYDWRANAFIANKCNFRHWKITDNVTDDD